MISLTYRLPLDATVISEQVLSTVVQEHLGVDLDSCRINCTHKSGNKHPLVRMVALLTPVSGTEILLNNKNASEKLILMEDATVLKKLANSYTQAVSHKKGELLKIQQEVQRIIHSVKEKEHEVHHLEMQLQQQFQQCQETERKLTESRSECIQLQALIHQLEETFLTGPPSTQQHVAKELREDIEKLRQVLREKELSADEDKYLCNKMAEDCGHLTKENGLLQAQVLEATRQLNKERQLREEESTSHSRSVSELARERERERQLEMELTYLKTLLQDERQRVLKVQEQVIIRLIFEINCSSRL
ncbi:Centromere-associated protein E [Varanus komodoensis]|nr:Centromere-associated protein E [Varanus komodoensis]